MKERGAVTVRVMSHCGEGETCSLVGQDESRRG